MKKMNGFYFSVVLLTLSAMTNSAFAADNLTAPGGMCSALNGAEQERLRTPSRLQLRVNGKGSVLVKCPIIEHNQRGGSQDGNRHRFRVIVRLFHPSVRTTSCNLQLSNRSGTTVRSLSQNVGNTGNRIITFDVPAGFTLSSQNSMLVCRLEGGVSDTRAGNDASTRLVSYQWIED